MPDSHSDTLRVLSALAQRTRIDVFRLLVRELPEGVPASTIAETLGCRANTLSSHLRILHQAGLIESERDGRQIHYRAVVARMTELVATLLEDCCQGRAQQCLAPVDPQQAASRGAIS